MTICPKCDVTRNGLPRMLQAVLVSVLSLSTGCESTQDPREMNEVEKASAISKKRRQAEFEFSTFQASDGDDLEALKRYAELHVETARIAPGSCENCFLYAGLALAQVASYYRAEVLLRDRRLQDAAPAETAQLEAEIEERIKLMRSYFAQSNRYFQNYFRQAGSLIEPLAYWRIADNYAALEDWRQALRYLDVFEQAQPLDESQSELKEIRKNFQVKLRLQEERQLDEELERVGGTDLRDRSRGEVPQTTGYGDFELGPRNDHVEETLLEQELAALESLG